MSSLREAKTFRKKGLAREKKRRIMRASLGRVRGSWRFFAEVSGLEKLNEIKGLQVKVDVYNTHPCQVAERTWWNWLKGFEKSFSRAKNFAKSACQKEIDAYNSHPTV